MKQFVYFIILTQYYFERFELCKADQFKHGQIFTVNLTTFTTITPIGFLGLLRSQVQGSPVYLVFPFSSLQGHVPARKHDRGPGNYRG